MTPTTLERPAVAAPITLHLPLVPLRDALARVSRVVPQKATLPILQSVVLSTGDGHLTLYATNLDCAVHATVPLDDAGMLFDAPVRVALPAADLTSALKHAAGETVTLILRAGRVELRAGRARYLLTGPDADDMPMLRAVDRAAGTSAARVPAGVLQRAVRRVAYAVSTEQSRPVMHGVCLEPDGDGLLLAALDGRRAAQLRLGVTLGLTGEAILPPIATDALAQVFAADEMVAVTVQAGMLDVRSDRHTVQARLIDGPFPPWRRSVRAASPIVVTIDRAALVAAIQRVAFAADDKFQPMGLAFTDGMCRVWTASDGSTAADTLPCVVAGDLPDGRYVTACGAAWLRDALAKTLTGPTAVIGLATTTGAPIQCTDPDDAAALAVVMPLTAPPEAPAETEA